MKHKFRFSDYTLEMTVGGIFVGAMVILIYFTVLMSTENWFRPSYRREVRFNNVSGLLSGDHVLTRGIRVGTVTDLRLIEDGVLVTLTLTEDLPIREGYQIAIRPGALLGGHYVAIELGPPEANRLPGDAVLEGEDKFDLMIEAASLLEEMRGDLERLRAQLDEAETVDKIVAFVDNLEMVSRDIREGRGVVGRLITDEEFYREFRLALDTIREVGRNVSAVTAQVELVVADARAGKGTVGRLITDPSLYNDLQAITRNLREGQGTIGRLIFDEQLHGQIVAIGDNIRNFTDHWQNEDSSGALLFRDGGELFRQVSSSVRSLAEVSRTISQGEGSLGKIIHDDELYQLSVSIMQELRSAVQDFREQSAVATFGSFIFGAF